MIQIKNKVDCCGCSACYSICPKSCIRMEEDQEGCLYPTIDRKACIDCGLCEKVCPIAHPHESRLPKQSYAATIIDESIRLQSSSGGVFSALADWIIERGGVVFGARFDENWDVCHGWTDSREGLSVFRGSKYVQSRIGPCYKAVKSFLEGNRWVLFSGTSCQIAGLKQYLRKEYDKLLTVDVICHGSPVPKAWRDYLKEIGTEISSISFRSKSKGWNNYHVYIKKNGTVTDQVFHNNTFMRGFLANLYLRPSCASCKFKSGRCQSDITLGDYWGVENVHPGLSDDKGISAVMLYTEKAFRIVQELPLTLTPTSTEGIIRSNPAYYQSCAFHYNRSKFFRSKSDFSITIERCLRLPALTRIKRRLLSFIKR